ncbi:hypothetical protein B0A50_03549 [Salinomyces thailandicus]|uniref:SGS-domain-containing protein n=1 Tax=Salinomyces thailandicus TaxID=706561 RepID=A0A4U0U554_9PEZI|nr:hypothetical protein B0A50_03549 [Salinomyces thailandica]
MATQANLGKKALESKNYNEAIKQFTLALKHSPTSPDYLINRSVAYLRNQQHAEALEDAENAVVYAQKRAKKELITESQFRRGQCMYNLGRYGDAQFVLAIVKRMQSDHKSADMWIKRTQTALERLPEDDEKRMCTVKETPDLDATGVTPASPAITSNGTAQTTSTSAPSNPTTATSAAPQQTPGDKIRHEWYQNNDKVYFTLLAKGVPQDQATVDITERSLTISFPLLSGSSYDLTLDPLFAPVKPSECITRVLPTKLEIILVKATAGQKWKDLESHEPATTTQPTTAAGTQETSNTTTTTSNTNNTAARASFSQTPQYPTSSRTGPKDWDKITKTLSTSNNADQSGKDPSASASASNDDDDDDQGGDASNIFFKKLFKNATPETQRAMMKSFTESNGTALSTNWEEVSKGKVETVAPDGMEARNW